MEGGRARAAAEEGEETTDVEVDGSGAAGETMTKSE